MDVDQYIEHLRSHGRTAIRGSKNTIWSSLGPLSLARTPVCALHVPPKEEIDEVFHKSHALLMNFAVAASAAWPANGYAYICSDQEYSLEKLPSEARTNTRRALRACEIGFVKASEVQRHGTQAFCDTFARSGREGGDAARFKKLFRLASPARRFMGAHKDGRLVGFAVLDEYLDTVLIGSFAVNEALTLRPNEGLIYMAIHEYLRERYFRMITGGLSTVQAHTNADGLHRFKTKMGFEARPIHRVFIVNPTAEWLVNTTTYNIFSWIMKGWPHRPVLKKIDGAFRMLLSGYEPYCNLIDAG